MRLRRAAILSVLVLVVLAMVVQPVAAGEPTKTAFTGSMAMTGADYTQKPLGTKYLFTTVKVSGTYTSSDPRLNDLDVKVDATYIVMNNETQDRADFLPDWAPSWVYTWRFTSKTDPQTGWEGVGTMGKNTGNLDVDWGGQWTGVGFGRNKGLQISFHGVEVGTDNSHDEGYY
jgi:hypothetical protein